jgi:hypothetical protein
MVVWIALSAFFFFPNNDTGIVMPPLIPHNIFFKKNGLLFLPSTLSHLILIGKKSEGGRGYEKNELYIAKREGGRVYDKLQRARFSLSSPLPPPFQKNLN